MEEYIENLSKYVESILMINKKRNIEFDEVLYFRGQSNKEYKLIPSLGRVMGQEGNNFYERNVIESAKLRLPLLFNSNDLGNKIWF